MGDEATDNNSGNATPRNTITTPLCYIVRIYNIEKLVKIGSPLCDYVNYKFVLTSYNATIIIDNVNYKYVLIASHNQATQPVQQNKKGVQDYEQNNNKTRQPGNQ